MRIPITGIPMSMFLLPNFCWFPLICLLLCLIIFYFVLDIVFEKLFIEIFRSRMILPLEGVFVCFCHMAGALEFWDHIIPDSKLEISWPLKADCGPIWLCKGWFAFGSSLPLRAQSSGVSAQNRQWFISVPPLVDPELQHPPTPNLARLPETHSSFS